MTRGLSLLNSTPPLRDRCQTRCYKTRSQRAASTASKQYSPNVILAHGMRNEMSAATSVKRKERSLMRRSQNLLSQGGLSSYDTQSLLYWLLRTSIQEMGLFCTIKRTFLPRLYWLVAIWVGQKDNFTSPIAGFPWHSTQRKDKGNLFFSLSGARGRLHQARPTSACLQYALQEARWMQGKRSCSQES
jgi:hypothetical protein